MKCTLLLLIFPFLVWGQDSIRLYSMYEKFTQETGVPHRTDVMVIGLVRDMRVSVVTTKNTITGKSMSAVRLSRDRGFWNSPPYSALYIDMDEVTGLGNALKYFSAVIKNGRPAGELSLNYITANDIDVTAQIFEFGSWDVTISQVYHHYRTIIPERIFNVRQRDVAELSEVVLKAKERWEAAY